MLFNIKSAILLAAALGLSVGYAQATPNAHHEDHGVFPFRAIHHRLHLTPPQEKIWRALEEKSTRLRKSWRKKHHAFHAQMKHALEQMPPDLARLARERDKMVDEQQRQRRRLQHRWLKFYAALTSVQKSVVRDTLKTRLERMEKHRRGKHWKMHDAAPCG